MPRQAGLDAPGVSETRPPPGWNGGRSVAPRRRTNSRRWGAQKALISLGGREVSEWRITEALWPDADGDLALRSFHTALYRLRALLGVDEVLRLASGNLTLNDHVCWVDAWAMERLLARFKEAQAAGDRERAARFGERAVELYAGPFLPEDVHAVWAHMREALLLDPSLTQERMRLGLFRLYKDQAPAQRVLDAWCKAGLPE